MNHKAKTGRSVQSTLFIGSLMKEMGKIAESKGRLIVNAEEYLARGCSKEETEELLSIDGFDRDMISAYLASTSIVDQPDVESNTDGKLWGFELKGVCGEKVTHDDLALELRASNKEEAIIKLQGVIKKEKDAGLDKIIDVFELQVE